MWGGKRICADNQEMTPWLFWGLEMAKVSDSGLF